MSDNKPIPPSTFILAAIAASLLTTAAAQAQQNVLEEIIVTAQKREQSLVDVPASVSVMYADEVHDLLGTGENIRALTGRVPSLVVESSNGRQSPRFYIRGLGNFDFDVNANQPVSMVFDEIALENAVLKSIPVFDIQRIEVLKGPQGTLFGRNTPAGIVKIESVRPSQESNGYALVSYGSHSTAGVEGAFGGGLSDTVSARLSVKYQTRSNWIDNTVLGPGKDFGAFDELAVRLQVLFEPDDSFRGLFKLHAFDQDGSMPQVFYANGLTIGSPGLRPGFDEKIASHDGLSNFELEQIGGVANLQFTFNSGLTLTSITGYDELDNIQRADVDGGLTGGPDVIGQLGRQAFVNIETSDAIEDHYQFTQEFRLARQVNNTFFQVGAYYFKEKLLVASIDYNLFPPPNLPMAETAVSQNTKSRALFGQIAHDLTDQLTITAGLRWTKDNKDLEVIPREGSFAPPQTIDAKDDYINYDLSLSYAMNEEWTWYGRLGNASRGPVTLGRFGFVSSAKTETLTSLEFGFKSLLMDGRMRWNTSIYAFEVDDQQLTATGGVGNTNELLNADKVKGRGFETDIEILVSENLRLIANASYNFTEIDDPNLLTEECGGIPHCTGLDPVVDQFLGFFGPVTLVSIDGNPLPRTPKWMLNGILNYTVPLSSGGEFYFNTDWSYRGNSNIFLYESVEFIAEKRWLGGVRIGYRNDGGSIDAAFVGRNITNEITVDGAIDFLNPTVFINEPRYLGGEIRFTY